MRRAAEEISIATGAEAALYKHAVALFRGRAPSGHRAIRDSRFTAGHAATNLALRPVMSPNHGLCPLRGAAAVDVLSGVETAPGEKSPALIRELLRAVLRLATHPPVFAGGSTLRGFICYASYRGRPRRSTQAVAIAEFGVSVPGTVAQPPFSMIDRRSHEGALFNSVNFAGASGCCRNLSTQIGTNASTTAVCARSFAIRSAVPPSVHPKTEKPSTHIAAAPITAPQIPGFKLGGSVMSCAPFSVPLAHRREISAIGEPGNTCDHVFEEPMNLDSFRSRFGGCRVQGLLCKPISTRGSSSSPLPEREEKQLYRVRGCDILQRLRIDGPGPNRRHGEPGDEPGRGDEGNDPGSNEPRQPTVNHVLSSDRLDRAILGDESRTRCDPATLR